MMHGGNVWQGGAPSAWLDFSANLRPEGAPEWVRRAMLEGMENARYYPDPQMRRARAALAEYLDLEADCVLPTAGGISAIAMAARLPVQSMRAFAPCFCEYGQMAALQGVRMEEISLLRAPHEILRPVETLGGTEISDCALWLYNPLNPVGVAFSPEEVEALLERAEAEKGWLIVDEAFIEFCPENSMRSRIGRHARLIVTGSMTKALGIPCVRLGYLCAQPELIDELGRSQLTWELNAFAEAVLCALPRHVEELRKDAKENVARRERLKAGLEALGAFVYPSSANFLLADFGRDVAPVAARLRTSGILVRECTNFSGVDDGRHLRLAVKDEAANARLLEELKGALVCAENH